MGADEGGAEGGPSVRAGAGEVRDKVVLAEQVRKHQNRQKGKKEKEERARWSHGRSRLKTR